MADSTQLYRPFGISDVDGNEDFLVRTGRFVEEMSRPFEVEVTLASETEQLLEPADVIGKNFTLRMTTLLQAEGMRYVNGFASRLVHLRPTLNPATGKVVYN